MTKYRVYLRTVASASVDVEVADGLDQIEAQDAAIDAAYEMAPDICAHCSGWGKGYTLELSDWEIEDGDDAVSEVEE